MDARLRQSPSRLTLRGRRSEATVRRRSRAWGGDLETSNVVRRGSPCEIASEVECRSRWSPFGAPRVPPSAFSAEDGPDWGRSDGAIVERTDCRWMGQRNWRKIE